MRHSQLEFNCWHFKQRLPAGTEDLRVRRMPRARLAARGRKWAFPSLHALVEHIAVLFDDPRTEILYVAISDIGPGRERRYQLEILEVNPEVPNGYDGLELEAAETLIGDLDRQFQMSIFSSPGEVETLMITCAKDGVWWCGPPRPGPAQGAFPGGPTAFR